MNPEPAGTVNGAWMPTVVFAPETGVTREALQAAFRGRRTSTRACSSIRCPACRCSSQPETNGPGIFRGARSISQASMRLRTLKQARVVEGSAGLFEKRIVLNFDERRKYWDDRAAGDSTVQSTTQDLFLRQIELSAPIQRVSKFSPQRVADVGSGDGRKQN